MQLSPNSPWINNMDVLQEDAILVYSCCCCHHSQKMGDIRVKMFIAHNILCDFYPAHEKIRLKLAHFLRGGQQRLNTVTFLAIFKSGESSCHDRLWSNEICWDVCLLQRLKFAQNQSHFFFSLSFRKWLILWTYITCFFADRHFSTFWTSVNLSKH